MSPGAEESVITSDADLSNARRHYAEELRHYASVDSEAVVQAFATVPREAFLGPGPWHVLNYDMTGYWVTEDDDPSHLYHNILVAIDPERGLNNGQPGFWAHLLDQLGFHAGERVLHIGAGVGYYTAIQAEIVGPEGRVVATELDVGLAARSRDNLVAWPNVEVVCGDGISYLPKDVDVIIVNAGVTHPQEHWLDALPFGGRLLMPLTPGGIGSFGGYLLVTRLEAGYEAHFVSQVGIYPAANGRDPEAEARLRAAFARTGYGGARRRVNSLRRDPHDQVESCWLHGPGFCLSERVVETEAPKTAVEAS